MACIFGPEVKVGQIWRNWDHRLRDVPDTEDEAGRFEILEVLQDKGCAVVQPIKKYPKKRPAVRRIKLERFRPNSTGYKLLKWEPRAPDAPVETATISVSDVVEVKDEVVLEPKTAT